MILKQDDSKQNYLYVGLTDFFQDYPDAIRFNLVHLCPSMLFFPFAVFFFCFLFFCCSTVLSGFAIFHTTFSML